MRTNSTSITRIVAVLICATMFASTASADIHVFWKRNTCPFLGDNKAPLAQLNGTMEAAFNPVDATNPIESVGGVYCNLFDADFTLPMKTNAVENASIGDKDATMGWGCVVCQYPDKVIALAGAMPAMSMGVMAFLACAGITFGLYQTRKCQQIVSGKL